MCQPVPACLGACSASPTNPPCVNLSSPGAPGECPSSNPARAWVSRGNVQQALRHPAAPTPLPPGRRRHLRGRHRLHRWHHRGAARPRRHRAQRQAQALPIRQGEWAAAAPCCAATTRRCRHGTMHCGRGDPEWGTGMMNGVALPGPPASTPQRQRHGSRHTGAQAAGPGRSAHSPNQPPLSCRPATPRWPSCPPTATCAWAWTWMTSRRWGKREQVPLASLGAGLGVRSRALKPGRSMRAPATLGALPVKPRLPVGGPEGRPASQLAR